VSAAAAAVITHNHPSGEPQPSEADIKVTRGLIRAGQFLKIEVLDHVIMGSPTHCSLREMGISAGDPQPPARQPVFSYLFAAATGR
jgi:DNA repair protein RadC